MPCRSDYLEPNERESESVLVLTLLKEVGLYTASIGCYGDTSNLDKHTAQLCTFCKSTDVAKHSLELQIWWRDHQKADEKRKRAEKKERSEQTDKEKALSKLSVRERRLLGLE